MSLYSDLTEAKIPTDNHESDLYFPDTPASRAILARHPLCNANATTFKHTGNGETWIDVPFAFAPWWNAKRSK